MKEIKFDLFKILAIILLGWLPWSMHEYAKNGRYLFDHEYAQIIIDTRTGKTYMLDHEINSVVESTPSVSEAAPLQTE